MMNNDMQDKKGKPEQNGVKTAPTDSQKNARAGGEKSTAGAEKGAQANGQNGAQDGGEGGAKSYVLMFVALGCFVVAVAAFVLSFFIAGWQTKILIVSMIFALACATLLNAQKRRAYSNACKVLQVLSYVLMIACVAVVIIGRMMAAQQ